MNRWKPGGGGTGTPKTIFDRTRPTEAATPKEPPRSVEPGSGHAKPIPAQESFAPEEPRRQLRDLILSNETQGRVNDVLAKIQYHKVLYEDWGLRDIDPSGGKTAVNLYGPPGTGKSMCAECLASALGVPIIRANYAELESKYVGETPKNIRAAFKAAKEAGALLFFDEADSILGKRLTNVTQSADHGVNVSRSVMLLELDAYNGVVVFATNLARNYDGAFVRRILAHIEISLPDEHGRERLWERHFPTAMPRSEDTDIKALARDSTGVSGGDILNAVISAASRAVQREGLERRVYQADLLDAISHIKEAKQAIGRRDVVTTTEEVPDEELPDEVRARVNEARGSVDEAPSDEALESDHQREPEPSGQENRWEECDD